MAIVNWTRPWYLDRHKTASALRSTWKLLFLSKEHPKRFFDSFDVFSMEWEARLADDPEDFRETSRKVADWYSVVNLLCSIGQIEKMYIPPRLEAGKSVHSLTGAGLVGFNVDESQVESANDFARQRRVDGLCQFHLRDLNDVPYPLQDGSVAAVYEIGAICYSTDLSRLFKDVHRILRPGGRVSLLDICMYDRYDPTDPEHVRLLSKTKPLTGLLRALHWNDYQRAFDDSGLKVVKNENPSIDGLMVPMIEYLNRYFVLAERVTKVGTRLRLLPAHLSKLLTKFNEEGEAFVAFDRGRLGTIAQYIVAEKPH